MNGKDCSSSRAVTFCDQCCLVNAAWSTQTRVQYVLPTQLAHFSCQWALRGHGVLQYSPNASKTKQMQFLEGVSNSFS